MEKSRYKTNIKCTGCVAAVTPFLNAAVGESNWEVDLTDPSKVLSVNTGTEADKVIRAMEKAGYKAEKI
jgi:copper chaperone